MHKYAKYRDKNSIFMQKKKDLKVAFTSQGTADKENASETARLSF